jgi:hypothetical protein
MRTLGFRTHVLLALAGAAGLLHSLGRPWYGAAPPPPPDKPASIGDLNGPLSSLWDGIQRWVTDPGGRTGWDALAHWGLAAGVMAGLAAAGALACLVPVLQPIGRDLLRYGAIAAFGIVAWRLFDPPGPNDVLELRRGALSAAVCALVLLTCGLGVANAPLRKRVPVRKYSAPPPPPAYGSAGPPGT